MNASFWAAFYGSSLAWYSPITALLGLLIMFSNATLLWLATTTSRIRVVGCNWIVINLAISDYSFGLVHVLSLVPYWICYEGSSACAALTVVCAALKTVAVSSASREYKQLYFTLQNYPRRFQCFRYSSLYIDT